MVDDRRVGGITEYRVRWKRHGKNDDEWMTMEEMTNARDSIRNYERATTASPHLHQEKTGRRRRRSRYLPRRTRRRRRLRRTKKVAFSTLSLAKELEARQAVSSDSEDDGD